MLANEDMLIARAEDKTLSVSRAERQRRAYEEEEYVSATKDSVRA